MCHFVSVKYISGNRRWSKHIPHGVGGVAFCRMTNWNETFTVVADCAIMIM